MEIINGGLHGWMDDGCGLSLVPYGLPFLYILILFIVKNNFLNINTNVRRKKSKAVVSTVD